jgi:hypothetical protein
MKKRKLKKIKNKIKNVITDFDKLVIIISVIMIWR